MNFKSDNVFGIHPKVLQAIIKANEGTEASYGNDSYSKKLSEKCCELFEKEVIVYLTNTGTAANCLGLSALAKPFETVCCHSEAHINTDECGALGLFSGGAKLVTIPGANGKIDLGILAEYIDGTRFHHPHGGKVSCISITQSTELGTVYTIEEMFKIQEFAKSRNLSLHMDGARFANSLMSLKVTPAELTWKVGIDVMTFGAIKNGTMAGEAIVFFNKKYAENFDYVHMRAGQLSSKMRFFSCQFLAYLENELWLKNAQQANNMAKNLLKLFNDYKIKPKYSVEANELFVVLPKDFVEYLRTHGAGFYEWGVPEENLYRFVTSFLTSDEDIKELSQHFDRYYSKIK